MSDSSGDRDDIGLGEEEEGMQVGLSELGGYDVSIAGLSEPGPGTVDLGEESMTVGEPGSAPAGKEGEVREMEEGKAAKGEKGEKDKGTDKTTSGSEKKKRRPMFLGLDESWFEPMGQAKTLKEKLGE